MKVKVKSLATILRYGFVSIVILSCNLPMLVSDSGDVDRGIVDSEDQASSQSYWILAIGGEGRDYAPSFHETEDGFVVVGMTSSYGFGDGGGNRDGSHDFLVVKLDKSGNHLWSRVIGGPGDERGSYSVRPAADSGFLLTGTTKSFGAGKTDMFIVKLKANGDLDWSKAIGGTGAEAGMTTLETADGYIALGDTDSFGAGKKDLLVVKLEPNGELAWAKTYGGIESDIGSGIAEVDGGYVIGGTIWSFGAGEADANAGLIKIDPQGDVIWAKTIGGSAGEGINWDGVRVTSDGGYSFGDKTASFGAKGNGALFGVKLNPDGELEWSTMVDGPGEDVGWTMNETEDGYIAGGKLTIPQHGGDVLIVKFDKDGNYLWSRIFGEAGLDEIEEIKPTEGGYIMAGVTRMIDPAGDFLVAKVDVEGFVGGDADPIMPLDPRSVVSITPQVQPFSPKVTDVSALTSVETIVPIVASPGIDIHEIHRNETHPY
ncbi:MAG: hypothetical protein ISS57_13935 [Anaerolineales bacterium]|nr:hypothetical protein [Chloroflexota bacterium]MBL7163695.1 hypothetical protein [Anaerolineales bacterium]